MQETQFDSWVGKICWRRDGLPTPVFLGFPWGSDSERICLQCGRPRFDPWVGKFLWRRAWQPTPVFLPGEPSCTEEPGGLQTTRSHRVGQDWATTHSTAYIRMFPPRKQTSAQKRSQLTLHALYNFSYFYILKQCICHLMQADILTGLKTRSPSEHLKNSFEVEFGDFSLKWHFFISLFHVFLIEYSQIFFFIGKYLNASNR